MPAIESDLRLVKLPSVLRPPGDAYLLAEHIRLGGVHGASVLDLCTGSGFLAIVAALAGAREVTAVDISRRAAIATRLNAALNRAKVRVVRGNLFAAVAGRRFDMIVSNPPYLPSATAELPLRGAARAWEAGPAGRAFLDHICAEAELHLEPGGVLLLVHSSVCDEQKTIASLAARGYRVEIVARQRGPLGPLLQTRSAMLRNRGMIGEQDVEDLVVVRAVLPPDRRAEQRACESVDRGRTDADHSPSRGGELWPKTTAQA